MTPFEPHLTERDVLEGQIRECYGRVVYSHKTHEKCADILLSRLSRLKLWQIVLSAITAAGFIDRIFTASFSAQISQVAATIGVYLGAIASVTLLAMSAYMKHYDLGELGQRHRQTAADLWLIREQYLSLLTDLLAGTASIESVVAKRDELLESLHSIYASAPSTTFKAYKQAQDALQHQEDMTFTDDEIDAFLPAVLRKADRKAS